MDYLCIFPPRFITNLILTGFICQVLVWTSIRSTFTSRHWKRYRGSSSRCSRFLQQATAIGSGHLKCNQHRHHNLSLLSSSYNEYHPLTACQSLCLHGRPSLHKAPPLHHQCGSQNRLSFLLEDPLHLFLLSSSQHHRHAHSTLSPHNTSHGHSIGCHLPHRNHPLLHALSQTLLRRECNLLTAVKGFKVDLEASRT